MSSEVLTARPSMAAITSPGTKRHEGSCRAEDRRVHPDQLPCNIDQRATRIAGVDRGIGLDQAFDRCTATCRDLAVERRDDAGRQRPVETGGTCGGAEYPLDLE